MHISDILFTSVARYKIHHMLFSYIDKNRISASMMCEILGVEEVGLTLYSDSKEVFKSLKKLDIPYQDKTNEEVLNFLFDRLLYEYMEHQSYYTESTYDEFKKTSIFVELQLLIYHVKSIVFWLFNNEMTKTNMSRNLKHLLIKTDVNPKTDTDYLKYYEQYKLYMSLVNPEQLIKYFNSIVGLKHFSVKTKAIYHAFVEEIEIRDIDYDSMLYSKERMLSYHIDIVIKYNKLIVIRK